MTAPALRFLLTADDRASGKIEALQSSLGGVAGSASKLVSALGPVGAALTGAFSVASLVAFTRGTVNGIDALNDLSDATGASIENLSALEDIAARTGTSMETVESAVIKLNKALLDATPGSQLEAAFKALGLSVKELKAQDPAENFRQVAVAMSRFADDGNKARLMLAFFQKSTKEIAPLLSDVAKAGELNATVTTEQAKQAERFNQALSAMAKNATDAAREISGPLVLALNGFFGAIARHEKNGGGVLTAYAETVNVAMLRNKIAGRDDILQAGAGKYSADKATLADGDMSLGGMWSKSMASERVAQYERSKKEAAGFRAELDTILYSQGSRRPANEGGGKFTTPSIGDVLGGGKPDKAGKPEAAKPFVSNSFDQSAILAIKAIESTDTAKVRELESALSGLFELQRETRGDPAVVAAIAKIRQQITDLSPGAKAAADELERMNAILAATPSGQLTAVLSDIQLVNSAFSTGKVSVEQWAEAMRAITGRLPDETKPALDTINTFAQEAGRNIQDALGDSILQSLSGNAASMGRIWTDMLKRMAAQAMAAQLGKLLLGDTYGKDGNIGGAFGALGSWLSSFGGTRASGGPVSPGRAYLVGERGPEIVVPRNAGTVLPNGTGIAGGSTSFVVNVQGDASANTLRLINGALAQFEARMLMRTA